MPSIIIYRDKELTNLSYVNSIKFVLMDVADLHIIQMTLTHEGEKPCLLKSVKLRSASAEEHGTTRRSLNKDSTCVTRAQTSGSIALREFTVSVMVLDGY